MQLYTVLVAAVAAARAWNSLPSFVTSASSLSTFKRHLKTYLFAVSYWMLRPLFFYCLFFPIYRTRRFFVFFWYVTCPCSFWTKRHVNLFVNNNINNNNCVSKKSGMLIAYSGWATIFPNTVSLITLEFILPDLWSPICPDLNPVDYEVWTVFRTESISTYVMLMSWNSISLKSGHTSVKLSLMRPSMRICFEPASMRRDVIFILNIWRESGWHVLC